MDDSPSRILIVDDIEENLKVLTDTLVQKGFRPLQAKSGERALEIARAALPDLILLDIRMPGMDGFETIEALKADPITADIPVIFISALNQTEDKIRGFSAGAVDYVSKPFQREEVLARVGTHLKLRQTQRQVEEEKQKSETLLLSILPKIVAEELKTKGTSEPQNFDNVTILFSDLVGFTEFSSRLDPRTLINELNDIFTAFDAIMIRHGCERIKTIGDAYFAASGMPLPRSDHAPAMVAAAKEMLDWTTQRRMTATIPWELRIGLHSGPVVAGIIGTSKYLYDVFGDTVNTASRMEALSEPGRINISRDTYDLLKGAYGATARDKVHVKGKGEMEMFYIL